MTKPFRPSITFRWAVDNPIIRFRYRVWRVSAHQLIEPNGIDDLQYFTTSTAAFGRFFKEIRLSDFDAKYHATTLEEVPVAGKDFDDTARLMGPMLEMGDGQTSFVLAYEHGSQYPDRFLEFRLNSSGSVSLDAVEDRRGQPVDSFETIWFEVGGVSGREEQLAAMYRTFLLKYISQNLDSRKPYIYYNTWGRQNNAKWAGGSYLSTENLATTLKEIEVAHRMGVDIYVLDAGWFDKTGDWLVNTAPVFFPDTLRRVKALLDKYGMRLGLWINPWRAAVSGGDASRADRDYVSGTPWQKERTWPVLGNRKQRQPRHRQIPYWNAIAD